MPPLQWLQHSQAAYLLQLRIQLRKNVSRGKFTNYYEGGF